MSEDRFLTMNEVAELLRVHRRTVERMMRDKHLTGFRVGNGRGQWRFRESVVSKLLESDAGAPVER